MAEGKKAKIKDAEDVTTIPPSADALRAEHDPTTDPHHTRGIDPAVADATFKSLGYPRGPLAGKKNTAAEGGEVAVAPEGGQPNPTADAEPPEGGIVQEGHIVDPLAKDQGNQ